MGIRVATDIGGTFTDLVFLDEKTDRVGLSKASTTPRNFADGIIHAIHKADFDPGEVTYFVHGTTIVINALTERKGVKTGLITTKGFRDVLEIGRANRPDIYNLRYRKPEPFVPRYLRHEVTERLNFHGEVLGPLNREEVAVAAQALKAEGVEAVAICFLHSYANPAHEQDAAAIVRAIFPEAYISMSHEIIKEWREYERTSTAVLNGYVKPTADRYLTSLESQMRDLGIVGTRDFYIMKSNGGTSTFAMAKNSPIHLVESGPVGGVMGAAVIGKAIGIQNLITLDIGGTTAKTSLIENGEMKVTTEYKIEWTPQFAGYPIKAPVVDIIEIGNGGGSIAWIDNTGVLRVGPKSAGADPGPASYGRGGTLPTLTDANLITGRINPDYFLGGEMKLSVELACKAYQPIADHFGISVDEAALGVIRLGNANMINALKLISVRRGYDPRDFALVACGGGGSMHTGLLAEELQIRTVIVPFAPGHFSAWGMLNADLRHDLIKTLIAATDEISVDRLNAIYAELEAEVIGVFRQEGMDARDLVFVRGADMRYVGQEHTVKVHVPGGLLAEGDLGTVEERFHAAHEQAYTFRLDGVRCEFVNFLLTVYGKVNKPQLQRLARVANPDPARALKGERPVNFDKGGIQKTPVYQRELLDVGVLVDGPAMIEETAASTVVYPGQRLTVDDFGNLIITTGVNR